MIRRFCDVCNAEVTHNAVHGRISGKAGDVQVELHLGVGGVWNQGEVCVRCAVAALQEVAAEYLDEEPLAPVVLCKDSSGLAAHPSCVLGLGHSGRHVTGERR